MLFTIVHAKIQWQACKADRLMVGLLILKHIQYLDESVVEQWVKTIITNIFVENVFSFPAFRVGHQSWYILGKGWERRGIGWYWKSISGKWKGFWWWQCKLDTTVQEKNITFNGWEVYKKMIKKCQKIWLGRLTGETDLYIHWKNWQGTNDSKSSEEQSKKQEKQIEDKKTIAGRLVEN